MSLTLIHSQEAEGLHATAFIPVIRDHYGNPDYSRTKGYIYNCIKNADIDNYGIYDRENGFTVALEGANAMVRFMYFFEGDSQQESELRFYPENEEQVENMVEWLSELTASMSLKDYTQLSIQGDALVLKFSTRSANVKTFFQIKHEIEEDQKLEVQSASNTPSPT